MIAGFVQRLLAEVRLARAKFPAPAPSAASAPPDMRDALARRALEVAYREIGHGELPGPPANRGPHVARWCAPHGDGHAYCAALAGYCYEIAARELGVDLPFSRSLGAKRLGKNAAAAGRRFADWRVAQAGDLMILHRGAAGSWQGHATIVARVDGDRVTTVEGNHGPRVAEVTRDLRDPRTRLAFFATVRRL